MSGPFFPPGDGRTLPGFPGSYRVRSKTVMQGGRLRPRWKAPGGRILEWDYQHGRELSPNLGDGLRDQAAAVWDCEDAGLAATSIPSVNLTP